MPYTKIVTRVKLYTPNLDKYNKKDQKKQKKKSCNPKFPNPSNLLRFI